MAIELVTKYLPYVDEIFTTESKKSLLTNNDFQWDGSKTVKIYKVSTANMNDYDRLMQNGWTSLYGELQTLNAITESFTLRKDRSFTFAIDRMDADETGHTLQAATALARQVREVVVPEVDAYVYGIMAENAGHKPEAVELTPENIYEEILKAGTALDNAEVPDTRRSLVVSPAVHQIMKKCKDIILETEIGADMRLKGVVGNLDGAAVVKIPQNRLPAGFGFMLCHPCATVAPTKLESYKIHEDPPGINGYLVEGRIVYDAHVMDNKKPAIYYQAQTVGA